jgi:hypothetical protein
MVRGEARLRCARAPRDASSPERCLEKTHHHHRSGFFVRCRNVSDDLRVNRKALWWVVRSHDEHDPEDVFSVEHSILYIVQGRFRRVLCFKQRCLK